MGKSKRGVRGEQPRNLLHDIEIETAEIPADKINPAGRMRIDYGSLESLELSIMQRGLIHPVVVMKYDKPFEGYDYFLLAGGRRLMAWKRCKYGETIPARIYPSDLDALEIRAIELEENLKRKEMNDGERLMSLRKLHNLYNEMYGLSYDPSKGTHRSGYTARETAQKLGVSEATISQDLKIAEYLEAVPELCNLKNKSEMVKVIKAAERQASVKRRLAAFDKAREAVGAPTLTEELGQAYVVGDFYTEIKKVQPKTFDLVDIDIDYPLGEDTALPQTNQMDRDMGLYSTVKREDFPELLQKAFFECYRVLKNPGWMIVWFGYNYFQEVQEWAKMVGFKTHWYHGEWYKGKGFGHTRNPQWTLNHSREPFFYFKKGSPEIIIPHVDVYEYLPNPVSKRLHPYEKPVPLMLDILRTFITPGSHILVPFCGSGNTLLAAAKHQCKSVGFDKSEDYRDRYLLKVIGETNGNKK